eukprot:gene8135-8218_t
MDYGPAPESNSDVQAWLAAHQNGFGHFINGKFTAIAAAAHFEVINPATEVVLAKVAHGTDADVDAAVRAARAAFDPWSKLSGHARAKYLYAIARHIQKRERFLAVLETMDNGKTIRETRDIDIPLVGLPAGVVNIVQGDGRTGAMLCGHAGLDKVAFTGSTEVGRTIRGQIAGSGKKLSLELGGKSPFIVFEDADMDGAVEGVVDAIWFNQGEVCCAGSRILVQEGIAERFYAKLRRRMETLRIGDPLDKTMDIGALVSVKQHARVSALVAQGKAEGGVLWQASAPLPAKGSFFAPGFFTDLDPAATLSQVEIFGPLATATTFRTPDEAITLANNTKYGLAASIWSENINLALDIAARVKAGVVWINSTNLFDAAAGFGGMRESGFGREGGREGLFEYLTADWERTLPRAEPSARPELSGAPDDQASMAATGAIDRTVKNYIGGKQARPDGGANYAVRSASGQIIGLAGIGSRKDIRNAVEAAAKARAWAGVTAHNRAQVLYYIGENLNARQSEFEALLVECSGITAQAAALEFDASLRRIFYYAAQADKFDGAVHATQSRHVTLAMHEPWGILGIACPDEAPLLSFVSLVLPAIAMGNAVVVVPSTLHPLLAANLYQVFDTSDLPAGVVNIVTGDRDLLTRTLAEHDEVDALWYVGSSEGSAMAEKASCGNLKATWVNYGRQRDWLNVKQGQGRDYLRKAVQVKNIWVPYGA